MITIPIKTPVIRANELPLPNLVLQTVSGIQDGDILAVSSKIVALCENNVRRAATTDREALIVEQSEYYLPKQHSKYGHHFTINGNSLVGSAGIDASNGGEHFVLWPENPQASANTLRTELSQRLGLKQIGVIITDSTSQPLRLGTIGISVAHSGFLSIHDYRGQPDLFGRSMEFIRSNIASGLAAAATLSMGEGTEQTPLCIIRDVPFVTFQDRDPSAEELTEIHISMEDDLFAPFLQSAPWRPGGKHNGTARS